MRLARMVCLVFPTLLVALAPRGASAEPDFDRDVAPILAGRCFECHSSGETKGKLDLSSKKGLLAGGENGIAIVAGKPSDSLLWQRIADGEMPPKKPLPDQERAILKEWIASGARWGSDPIDPYRFSTAMRAGSDWWSLQPLSANPSDSIDSLIDRQLAARKLRRSPATDKRTLIRRLYFDMVGLPPSPEETDKFAADASPDAYAKLVDSLLASPHYGERWARHWLDVAHFGESDGFEFDRIRPNAWRYRDWVIDSLNRDLPFDRFAKLQIAGDAIAPGDPTALTATGFLAAGAFDSLQPAGEPIRQIMRQDELEDIVGIVGQSFLGMTVNCARCHDHKFDPIRQTDYYRLASALSGVRRGDRSLRLPVPADLASQVEALRQAVAGIEEPVRERIRRERTAGTKARPAAPKPFASWDFSKDLRDGVGDLHGRAVGNARIADGALKLDGKSYVVTGPLPVGIIEKTFEAWVKLDNLEQRGGGVIGLQSPDGANFDTLVFAEKEPGRWLAGSHFYQRTRNFDGPGETEAKGAYVHVALTYAGDGTIAAYRQGVPYGNSYQVEKLFNFHKGGEYQVIFGLRHGPQGGNKHLAGSILRANLYNRALSADEIAASAASPDLVTESELVEALSVEQRGTCKKLTADLLEAEARLVKIRDAKTFAVTPAQPPVTHRLKRGNPAEKAEPVSAGGLSAVKESEFGLEADAPEAERRRKLAEWIASERNPLFARTIVNRVWQYHFGRGLVDTANDLGFNGGVPVHKELLDWLALELIRNKWSLKELHRTIVLSQTYRQSSDPRPEAMAIDADNRLVWRCTPRRLDAEQLRDATLVVAGQLNRAVGGPSYQDFRPFFFRGSQFYEPLDPVGPEFNRRSIYRMGARGGRNPLLETFDCPDPSTTAPKRGSTTTPLQALALMNNSFTLRMADHFAERLRKEAGEAVDQQIALGFRLVYGRVSTESETIASHELVTKHGLAPFCRVLLNTNGFLYVH